MVTPSTWEDEDSSWVFENVKCKGVTTSEIEEEIVVLKPKINLVDPEFDFCPEVDYASVYCTGTSGVGKKSKAAVSCTILNHMGVIVDDGSKYIGDGVTLEQLSIESILFGLEKAKYNHFNKVCIYTDYKVPSVKQVSSYVYTDLKHEWSFKLIIDKFEEYTVINIPRKLNIVTIRLAEKAITSQKKSQKNAAAANRGKTKNEQLFKNRFKK